MSARVLNLRTWMRRARCRGADYDFVPFNETSEGLRGARTWCDVCPVREECLMTAMRNSWHGYWGGTMTTERMKLKSSKHRVKCPLCTSVMVVSVDGSQVCIACGRSWPTGRPPAVKKGKRPSERTADPQQEEVLIVGDAL